MRPIKKVVKVLTIVVYYYDRIAKEEKTITVKRADFEKDIPLVPENGILIEHSVVEENEVTFTMSPEVFLQHATEIKVLEDNDEECISE